MTTTGSGPTTQASCPGGISEISPGPNSAWLPSSINTAEAGDVILQMGRFAAFGFGDGLDAG